MTQESEEQSDMNRRHRQVGFRAGFLLLIFCLSALMLSSKAYSRTGASNRQSLQEPSGAGNEKEITGLEPGKPIKRELGGGQQHSYQVRLNADQFLKVVVEQQGVDVEAAVTGPDGKQILEFDSESRPEGQEEVSLVAGATGSFLLNVYPKLNGVPSGSYEIRIEELRAATNTDRALYDARKGFEEALKLQRAGKYEEALRLAESALEIRERFLGTEDQDVAVTLDGLAGIYLERGEYAKAESLYRRALDIRERAVGEDHTSTAYSLNNLAVLYYYQGKYVEAEPLYKRALEIWEKTLGKDHPNTANSLNSLAALYASQGKHVEAESLYKRAIDIREKTLGKDHPNTALSLNNLAVLYDSRGRYVESELIHKRALAIREKALGNDHPATAQSLNSLALLYTSQGKYGEAEPLHKRTLEIREKTLGNDHPHTAQSLNNLAIFYYHQGKYGEAEQLYKRALETYEKVLGKDHPVTAGGLNNLATLYSKQGKYAEAELLHKRALTIREKALGNDHPDTANSLNNLAELYKTQRRYGEAEPLYQRALAISEKALGKDHSNIAYSLNNLALLYTSEGKYVDAEPLLKRALEIWEKALGKEHPNIATTLNNLAELYREQGKYVDAEPLYQRALAIYEKALGKDHPSSANSLNNLALLHLAKGELVQAIRFQSLANTAVERNLARNLVIGSERQKLAYLANLSNHGYQTISVHLQSAPADPEARNMAATLILQRKGRGLDATSQNLNALRSRFNTEDQALLDRLTETRSQIARLVLYRPQRMTDERYQARIKELEDQAEKDEADISRRSSEFRAQYLPVTLEAVRAAIPADAALIEFVSYRPFNAKATKDEEAYGQPRYAAYILRREGEIEWKELGEAKVIDRAIAALRYSLRAPKRWDVKRLARAVDARVFQPIRPLLGDVTRLLISPDGSLNLIPFAALVDERMRYAVERYSISHLTSGRDLLRLQVARESKSGPLVIAAPDFGRRNQETDPSKGELKDQIGEESTRSAFKDFYFPPLPYAAREGETLHSLLLGATLLTNRQATKAALSQIRSPRLLHIATHGFFLEDQQLTSTGERGAQSLNDDPERALRQLVQRGIRIESPLLRSGLALAGANEHKQDDNGILTALEMTGLNLWGTKLVVLSACDTGVGEVKNGDGVHGLRRALVLAGAETQVMSLWPVSDKATRELMVAYYRKLQGGQGRGEALRQVQLEMLKNVNRRHPYYWASFIQSGEWANLKGKRVE